MFKQHGASAASKWLALASIAVVFSACNVKSPDFTAELRELRVCEVSADGECPEAGTCVGRLPGSPSVLPVGQELQLCASGLFGGLSSPDDGLMISAEWRDVSDAVRWSQPADTAGFFGLSDTGLLTGISVSSSPVAVTASLAGTSGSSNVLVTAPVLEALNISPQSLQRLLVGTEIAFRCFGQYSADKACTGPSPDTCDVTADATWFSDPRSVVSVNNTDRKGVAEAVAEGVATVACALDGKTSDPVATVRVCGLDAVTSLMIQPATVAPVAVDTTIQLSAIAEYVDCGGSETLQQDVSDIVVWASSNDAIATVDGGTVEALSPGSANITVTLPGAPNAAPVVISVIDALLARFEITGPTAVAPGFDLTATYTATATFLDPDTGEELDPVAVSDDATVLWTSSNPEALSFGLPAPNVAEVLASADVPQKVTIAASYRGLSASTETDLIAFAREALEILPSAVCLTPMMEETAQMQALAVGVGTSADGTQFPCSLNVTELATWSAEASPGCMGTVPMMESPVLVSNTPPKGEVSINYLIDPLLPVLGMGCVTAAVLGETLDAPAAVGDFGLSCLGAETQPSVARCAELFASPGTR